MSRFYKFCAAAAVLFLLLPVSYAQEGPPAPENISAFRGNLFALLQQQPLAYDQDVSKIPLYINSTTSAILIQLREGVKAHYHAKHDEIVYILQGKGVMTVGDVKQVIKAGDLIVMERGKTHSVINKSAEPLVALSIMSPPFDGQDRVFVE